MLVKDYQVKRMFETIAFSYDLQNSFLSLRRDSYWRRVLAQSLRLRDEALVLDMGLGMAVVVVVVVVGIVVSIDLNSSYCHHIQERINNLYYKRTKGLVQVYIVHRVENVIVYH